MFAHSFGKCLRALLHIDAAQRLLAAGMLWCLDLRDDWVNRARCIANCSQGCWRAVHNQLTNVPQQLLASADYVSMTIDKHKRPIT